MGIRRAAIALILATSPLAADELSLACAGVGWDLDLGTNKASLNFLYPSEMDVMLDTPAEGFDWPRALSLVGERDSAILILNRETCEGGTHSAQLLTQRGQTPIFLLGCCEAGP